MTLIRLKLWFRAANNIPLPMRYHTGSRRRCNYLRIRKTVHEDVSVPGSFPYRPVRSPSVVGEIDGLRVRLYRNTSPLMDAVAHDYDDNYNLPISDVTLTCSNDPTPSNSNIFSKLENVRIDIPTWLLRLINVISLV